MIVTDRAETQPPEPTRPAKRVYRAPKLAFVGTVETVTRSGGFGGEQNEGGMPLYVDSA